MKIVPVSSAVNGNQQNHSHRNAKRYTSENSQH